VENQSEEPRTHIRLTTSQALVRFLANQWSERDQQRQRVIPTIAGIFGHGNVTAFAPAIAAAGSEMGFYQAKNEQAMVHVALGYAKATRRLSTFACTASSGPGSTNMITGCATAAANRLPVLLLPSGVFTSRLAGPVLQQIEHPMDGDADANDVFRPLSRFFDRITRPEQLLDALPEAIRVLLDPADTGPVTISLPQDVQAEPYDFPSSFFEPRVWTVTRRVPDDTQLQVVARAILDAKRPLIIFGGGVRYSGAEHVGREFVHRFGLPVAETFAGRGMATDGPMYLGGLGLTGSGAANQIANKADLVLAVGSRLTDFATASRSLFRHPDVKFASINVNGRDAHKMGSLPLEADARVTFEALTSELSKHNYRASKDYAVEVKSAKASWARALSADITARTDESTSQAEYLWALNTQVHAGDVVVAAAGSPVGDLMRLWNVTPGSDLHLEFGSSCMGHEIPSGIGYAMSEQYDGDVFVCIGDGTYLMMHSELVTAVQDQIRLIVVVFVNDGFQCIRDLQEGTTGLNFGTEFRLRSNGAITDDYLIVDYAANAASYGCRSETVTSPSELIDAIGAARSFDGPTVVACRTERHRGLISDEEWWDLGLSDVGTTKEHADLAREHANTRNLRQRFYYHSLGT